MTSVPIDIKLHHGDCLEVMPQLAPASVDLILCDLPYDTTQNKWDSVIPLEMLWAAYRRIRKPNAAVVLHAAQPFTSALVMSNAKEFKYDWCWIKTNCSGFGNAKKQPLRSHESVLIFCKAVYFPQGCIELKAPRIRTAKVGEFMGRTGFKDGYTQTVTNYPRSVITIASERGLHPAQKPMALAEYLIKTYSNFGDTVLDNCMGSGTTGVACKNLGRNFIGIEKDEKYFRIAEERIQNK